MKNTTFRRTSAAAVATLALSLSLVACGDEADEAADTASDATSAAGDAASDATEEASESPSEDAAGEGAEAQTFGEACSAVPTSGPGSFDGMVQDPVATAASNNPLLSTLVEAVTAADLVGTLNDLPAATVFAPTNDAFAAIPKKDLKAVLADKELLSSILTYHVIGEQLDPEAVVGEQESVQGGTVEVEGDTEGMTVNGANVLCGNIPTANATVYVIDQVLMPPAN
ncbi:MAG: fasciclin domain-containing protein [Nocardioides sp.]|uniref:fasciclin domain-containing protein n=1 Tax=Nocardioides sp. Leaf374 TaxID=2876560 RepID=UPI001A225209|nr:fasciclin domain-containing protein [Nocardioides sp. Leaf374]MBJ7528476.1 fasciclin domain-containing protein [Nocardioides sp.]